jgi:hypothetical protein
MLHRLGLYRPVPRAYRFLTLQPEVRSMPAEQSFTHCKTPS